MNAFEKDTAHLINDVEGFMKGCRQEGGPKGADKAWRLWRVLECLQQALDATAACCNGYGERDIFPDRAKKRIADARAVLEEKA